MAFSDQSALFTNNSLLTWQLMDQMADNDAYLYNATLLSGMPAFSAYNSGSQTLSKTTPAKVSFGTEIFDRTGCYDTSLSRFQPTVAGKYILIARIEANFIVSAGYGVSAYCYKNGSLLYPIGFMRSRTTTINAGLSGAVVVDANGSSDYFEIFAVTNTVAGGETPTIGGGQGVAYFQGHIIKTRI